MRRSRHIGRSLGSHSGCSWETREAPRRPCSGRGGTPWRGTPWPHGGGTPRPPPSSSPPAPCVSPTPPRAAAPPPPPAAVAAAAAAAVAVVGVGAQAGGRRWRSPRREVCLALGGAGPCLSGAPGLIWSIGFLCQVPSV